MLLLLLACAGADDSAPPADCARVGTRSVPLAEVTELGFAAQVVVDLVRTWSGPVTYAAHPASTVTVEPQLDVPTARVETWGGADPACPDRVALDGHFVFTTADGLFVESWYVPFAAAAADVVTAQATLDPVAGAWDPAEADGAAPVATTTWTATKVSGGVSAGALEVAAW